MQFQVNCISGFNNYENKDFCCRRRVYLFCFLLECTEIRINSYSLCSVKTGFYAWIIEIWQTIPVSCCLPKCLQKHCSLNYLGLFFKKTVSHILFLWWISIFFFFVTYVFKIILELILCWQPMWRRRNDKRNYSPLESSVKFFNYIKVREIHMQIKTASIKKGGSTM